MPVTDISNSRAAWDLSAIRQAEADAIEQQGLPAALLMERAARAAFGVIRRRWPQARKLLVVCGRGNNGGDGYRVAALAADAGWTVSLFELHRSPRTAEGRAARQTALASGVEFLSAADRWPDAELLVDALLGIGFSGALRDQEAAICDRINANEATVMSLDVPSGVDVGSGAADARAVRADLTLSFIGLKAGLLTGSAAACAGEIEVENLGIGELLDEPRYALAGLPDLQTFLAAASADVHKGQRGTCLVIGGAPGMAGAAILCAQAALMTGVGKVRLASPCDSAMALMAKWPEIMVSRVTHYRQLMPLLEDASSLVVGPGLGQSPWAQQMLLAALDSDLPIVLDADALRLMSETGLRPRGAALLTPHPGEAAALLNTDTSAIQSNRFAALDELVCQWNSTVILKGNGSLIGAPHHGAAICAAGTPAMARAGMGDVLAGLAGGLAARSSDLFTVACAASWWHAAAAEDLEQIDGSMSVLPSRLITHLPRFMHQLSTRLSKSE